MGSEGRDSIEFACHVHYIAKHGALDGLSFLVERAFRVGREASELLPQERIEIDTVLEDEFGKSWWSTPSQPCGLARNLEMMDSAMRNVGTGFLLDALHDTIAREEGYVATPRDGSTGTLSRLRRLAGAGILFQQAAGKGGPDMDTEEPEMIVGWESIAGFAPVARLTPFHRSFLGDCFDRGLLEVATLYLDAHSLLLQEGEVVDYIAKKRPILPLESQCMLYGRLETGLGRLYASCIAGGALFGMDTAATLDDMVRHRRPLMALATMAAAPASTMAAAPAAPASTLLGDRWGELGYLSEASLASLIEEYPAMGRTLGANGGVNGMGSLSPLSAPSDSVSLYHLLAMEGLSVNRLLGQAEARSRSRSSTPKSSPVKGTPPPNPLKKRVAWEDEVYAKLMKTPSHPGIGGPGITPRALISDTSDTSPPDGRLPHWDSPSIQLGPHWDSPDIRSIRSPLGHRRPKPHSRELDSREPLDWLLHGRPIEALMAAGLGSTSGETSGQGDGFPALLAIHQARFTAFRALRSIERRGFEARGSTRAVLVSNTPPIGTVNRISLISPPCPEEDGIARGRGLPWLVCSGLTYLSLVAARLDAAAAAPTEVKGLRRARDLLVTDASLAFWLLASHGGEASLAWRGKLEALMVETPFDDLKTDEERRAADTIIEMAEGALEGMAPCDSAESGWKLLHSYREGHRITHTVAEFAWRARHGDMRGAVGVMGRNSPQEIHLALEGLLTQDAMSFSPDVALHLRALLQYGGHPCAPPTSSRVDYLGLLTLSPSRGDQALLPQAIARREPILALGWTWHAARTGGNLHDACLAWLRAMSAVKDGDGEEAHIRGIDYLISTMLLAGQHNQVRNALAIFDPSSALFHLVCGLGAWEDGNNPDAFDAFTKACEAIEQQANHGGGGKSLLPPRTLKPSVARIIKGQLAGAKTPHRAGRLMEILEISGLDTTRRASVEAWRSMAEHGGGGMSSFDPRSSAVDTCEMLCHEGLFQQARRLIGETGGGAEALAVVGIDEVEQWVLDVESSSILGGEDGQLECLMRCADRLAVTDPQGEHAVKWFLKRAEKAEAEGNSRLELAWREAALDTLGRTPSSASPGEVIAQRDRVNSLVGVGAGLGGGEHLPDEEGLVPVARSRLEEGILVLLEAGEVHRAEGMVSLAGFPSTWLSLYLLAQQLATKACQDKIDAARDPITSSVSLAPSMSSTSFSSDSSIGAAGGLVGKEILGIPVGKVILERVQQGRRGESPVEEASFALGDGVGGVEALSELFPELCVPLYGLLALLESSLLLGEPLPEEGDHSPLDTRLSMLARLLEKGLWDSRLSLSRAVAAAESLLAHCFHDATPEEVTQALVAPNISGYQPRQDHEQDDPSSAPHRSGGGSPSRVALHTGSPKRRSPDEVDAYVRLAWDRGGFADALDAAALALPPEGFLDCALLAWEARRLAGGPRGNSDGPLIKAASQVLCEGVPEPSRARAVPGLVRLVAYLVTSAQEELASKVAFLLHQETRLGAPNSYDMQAAWIRAGQAQGEAWVGAFLVQRGEGR